MIKLASSIALLALSFSAVPGFAKGSLTPPLVGASIFDDGLCWENVECGFSSFCADIGPFGGICRKRTAAGGECSQSESCAPNTFCRFADTRDGKNLCTPQSKAGQKCSSESDACVTGLICQDERCVVAPPPGRAGATCSVDLDCDQDGGFYCKNDPMGAAPSKCAPKFKNGAVCGQTSDNRECLGFCSRGPDDDVATCRPVRPVGGPCIERSQCASLLTSPTERDFITCNMPRGLDVPGVCTRVSQLKTQLGAACSPSNDLCDASRNLVCRLSKSVGSTVCQQKVGRRDSFCKRGNKFSSCNKGLECRVRRKVPAQASLQETFKVVTTQCLPVRHMVTAGAPCDLEPTVCGPSTSCRVVPGVRLSFDPRRGPPSAVYCVRTLRRLSQCSPKEKFLALCEDGFECSGGKCMKSRGGAVPETHANKNVSCEDLPCTPGFKCDKFKRCSRA